MSKVNRDEIIEAAVDLFHANGYHATSMRDIARAVNLKKPSLYHHFDSKESILLAILEAGMDRLIEAVEPIVASRKNAVDKLRAAVTAHACAIAEHPKGASVFLREDRGLGETYISTYSAKRDYFEHLLRQIIKQGVEEGTFRTNDITVTVHALLGSVNWMTRWYRAQGRLTPDEIAEEFTALFLQGLTPTQEQRP